MQNQYLTLSLSIVSAMGLMERDPLFLKSGTRFEQENRELCWHALFSKTPEQLEQWLEKSQSFRSCYEYHLNECRAWLWLTLYNQHFINIQLADMDRAKRTAMVEHLNRLWEQHEQFQLRHVPTQHSKAKPFNVIVLAEGGLHATVQ